MKITEKEFNSETGKETIIERDETAVEKKNRETRQKELAVELADIKAKQTERQAIADRLGLTADELKLLFG